MTKSNRFDGHEAAGSPRSTTSGRAARGVPQANSFSRSSFSRFLCQDARNIAVRRSSSSRSRTRSRDHREREHGERSSDAARRTARNQNPERRDSIMSHGEYPLRENISLRRARRVAQHYQWGTRETFDRSDEELKATERDGTREFCSGMFTASLSDFGLSHCRSETSSVGMCILVNWHRAVRCRYEENRWA